MGGPIEIPIPYTGWGYWRSIVVEVVDKYLARDPRALVARVRCGSCRHVLLLPFSCKATGDEADQPTERTGVRGEPSAEALHQARRR